MLKKIEHLLKSGTRNDIELAYQLSLSSKISLWPIERDLKDILYISEIFPNYGFDNIPLGQLCLAIHQIIKLSINNKSNTEIPNRFDYFTNLEMASFINIPIRKIPHTISQHKKIKTLSIINTEIEDLSELIEKAELQSLILANNKYLKINNHLINKINGLKRITACKKTSEMLDVDHLMVELKII